MQCAKCGKNVTNRNLGSRGGLGSLPGGYGYVRCRPCTRAMLRGAKVQTLDTRTGQIKRDKPKES